MSLDNGAMEDDEVTFPGFLQCLGKCTPSVLEEGKVQPNFHESLDLNPNSQTRLGDISFYVYKISPEYRQ